MSKFPFAEQICAIKDPLHWTPKKNELMVAACKEMALFHQKNCPEIFHLYKKENFDPHSINSVEDLARIPAIGVTAMKYYLITSKPHEEVILRLTSSGTRGQKTQIWFDQASLDRVQRQMDVYLEQEGITSSAPQNYLIFNYDPDDAGDLGIAYSEKNQLRFAPTKESYYAIKKDKTTGAWVFHKEKALEKLLEFIKRPEPLRVFGMPAFIFEFLELLQEKKISVKAHPDSWLTTGGGWKASENKKITKEHFRELVVQHLGITDDRIRDGYGMAEHCAPYFECKDHRFHIPVYCRILIRNPETLEVLSPGQVGLMELITPFNAMMPTLAILTTDYGIVDAEPCTCGWESPTFTLVGRAGISKHKGCAMTAADIVKR